MLLFGSGAAPPRLQLRIQSNGSIAAASSVDTTRLFRFMPSGMGIGSWCLFKLVRCKERGKGKEGKRRKGEHCSVPFSPFPFFPFPLLLPCKRLNPLSVRLHQRTKCFARHSRFNMHVVVGV